MISLLLFKNKLVKIILGVVLITLTILIFYYFFWYNPKPDVYILKDPVFSTYEIKYIGDQTRESRTTVLTTLFHFSKSKHRVKEYEKWFSKMLASLGAPLIAYVDYYWAPKFIEKCRHYNLTGKNKTTNVLI